MELAIFIILSGSIIVILACLASIFWFGGLLLPILFSGAPFVPSSKERVDTMIKLANIKPTDHVVDMGSGEGQFLIKSIKAGAQSADGYEIHPGLVVFSRWRAKRNKMQNKIHVFQKSFWKADVSKATIVFLYLLPNHMVKLETKLKNELPIGARIISNEFTFPNWTPVKQEEKIYVYEKTGS
ncbi:50S ribosomal protein L11 methyltransferase [Candidatus Uhrbacteria bacterium]|nr:50S ribosomal protein L11 methyltransferase [Candidatus Uhrbacteria bacterium]